VVVVTAVAVAIIDEALLGESKDLVVIEDVVSVLSSSCELPLPGALWLIKGGMAAISDKIKRIKEQHGGKRKSEV